MLRGANVKTAEYLFVFEIVFCRRNTFVPSIAFQFCCRYVKRDHEINSMIVPKSVWPPGPIFHNMEESLAMWIGVFFQGRKYPFPEKAIDSASKARGSDGFVYSVGAIKIKK